MIKVKTYKYDSAHFTRMPHKKRLITDLNILVLIHFIWLYTLLPPCHLERM